MFDPELAVLQDRDLLGTQHVVGHVGFVDQAVPVASVTAHSADPEVVESLIGPVDGRFGIDLDAVLVEPTQVFVCVIRPRPMVPFGVGCGILPLHAVALEPKRKLIRRTVSKPECSAVDGVGVLAEEPILVADHVALGPNSDRERSVGQIHFVADRDVVVGKLRERKGSILPAGIGPDRLAVDGPVQAVAAIVTSRFGRVVEGPVAQGAGRGLDA